MSVCITEVIASHRPFTGVWNPADNTPLTDAEILYFYQFAVRPFSVPARRLVEEILRLRCALAKAEEK